MLKRTIIVVISLAALGFIGSQIACDKSVAELTAYQDQDSRFVNISGLDVHYRDQGRGVPLVLLHGTGASLHTWQGWVDALADSFRVIRMDLPGFGLTGPNRSRDYSIENYVGFLRAFLDSLGIDKCHLAGNSLGGLIAWHFTLDQSSRVDRLILVDSAGFPYHETPRTFKLAQNWITALLLRHFSSKKLVHQTLEEVYYDKSKVTPDLVRRYYDINLRAGNRQAFIDRANTVFEDRTAELAEIEAETLILWGKHDPWDSFETGEKFAHQIPNSKLIVYANAGHVPMEEIPEQTAHDVEQFLSESIQEEVSELSELQ